MRIINLYNDSFPTKENVKGEEFAASVVALGNFDGVHLGHKNIISKCVAIAKEKKLSSAIITFDPHPISVLRQNVKHFALITLEQKIQMIEKLGIDLLFVIKFNTDFAKITARDFIASILGESGVNAKHVVVGHDFTFGHNREGNVELLAKYLDVTQVPAIGNGEEIFSSTKIREYLANGNVEKAEDLLGYKFFFEGVVQNGAQMGRKLGFPTANLSLGSLIRPRFGVYATTTIINDKRYKSISNIGKKPSLGENEELIETHIFDFADDIYGEKIKVELDCFIRDEKKFDKIEDLQQQISLDCAKRLS